MIDNRKDLTKNKFLGNKLEIVQFSDGYRGNIESVLVAAAVAAESGQKILELGCGNGVALCCLLYRISGLEVFGIEIDKKVADLCQQNIASNKFKANIFIGDITTNIKELKSKSFDHVFMNPPFFKKNSVIQSPTLSSRLAKVERVALSEWILVAKKRCKPKGLVTIIQRVERLPEIIKYLNGDFGQITVQPLSSFKDTSPKTVIVQAKKSSRAAFKLLASKVVHKRDKDTGSVIYEDEFEEILRNGHPLQLN